MTHINTQPTNEKQICTAMYILCLMIKLNYSHENHHGSELKVEQQLGK